jgi:hypothetical protein
VRFVHVMRRDQDGAAVCRETARAPPTTAAATADPARSSARRETAARARRPARTPPTAAASVRPTASTPRHRASIRVRRCRAASSTWAARIERAEHTQRFGDRQLSASCVIPALDAHVAPVAGSSVADPSLAQHLHITAIRGQQSPPGFQRSTSCRRRSARASQNIRRRSTSQVEPVLTASPIHNA